LAAFTVSRRVAAVIFHNKFEATSIVYCTSVLMKLHIERS